MDLYGHCTDIVKEDVPGTRHRAQMFVAAAQKYADSCTNILERSPEDLQLKS